MHTHIFGTENDLLLYIANGVTTIKTLGGGSPLVLDWRDEIREGNRVGPNIWSWWPMLESDQEESFEWGAERAAAQGKIWIHTPEEAEQLVADMAELGVDGIKSHGQPADIFTALLRASEEHGLAFDGHVPTENIFCPSRDTCGFETAQEAWDDFRAMGAPALAHVEELTKVAERLDPDTRELNDEHVEQIAQDVADDGMWITSTVHMFRTIVDQASDLQGALDSKQDLKYVNPAIFGSMKWGPGENYYVELGGRSYYPNYLSGQERMLLALYESGANLMSGTDANSPIIVPGFSLHDELETMVDVGMPPYEVLKTSTLNPAVYLGESDEFGTVEEGKRADLVLLDESPLDDITNTKKISAVVAQGTYFGRDDLDTMLDAVAEHNEGAESSRAMAKIALPVGLVLVMGLMVFGILRMRKRKDTT